ncbi:MAG: three-Cys-motif partner protein TcmP [candidate division Zixibacteria bacterium]|nr:three-Cys-motif partner protein TcmP [candidate division Zixibacteria bacterium]
MNIDRIGPWSEIKLEIVKKYLSAYTTVLKNRGFHFSYIDGFAGAGQHFSRENSKVVPGSPLIACQIDEPFKKYIFIEIDEKKTLQLDEIKEQFPNLDIEIKAGDCNPLLIKEIFPHITFENYRRALCLLDPYGLHLDWNVVEMAGKSKVIELFINFPIMDMQMNVLWTKRISEISPAQVIRMNKFMGCESWKEKVFQQDLDLFDEDRQARIPKAARVLADYYRERLVEIAGFEFVPEPLLMENTSRAGLYYLFFASPNKTGNKIVKGIFSKYRKGG